MRSVSRRDGRVPSLIDEHGRLGARDRAESFRRCRVAKEKGLIVDVDRQRNCYRIESWPESVLSRQSFHFAGNRQRTLLAPDVGGSRRACPDRQHCDEAANFFH
jgi:hypothetical protein